MRRRDWRDELEGEIRKTSKLLRNETKAGRMGEEGGSEGEGGLG